MTNTDKRILFLRKLATLIDQASLKDIDFIVTSFHRTAEEQNELFEEGKSKADGYEKKSKQQDWLAVDIVIIEDGNPIWKRTDKYNLIGNLWEENGGTWGGSWKSFPDIFHFELGEQK